MQTNRPTFIPIRGAQLIRLANEEVFVCASKCHSVLEGQQRVRAAHTELLVLEQDQCMLRCLLSVGIG